MIAWSSSARRSPCLSATSLVLSQVGETEAPASAAAVSVRCASIGLDGPALVITELKLITTFSPVSIWTGGLSTASDAIERSATATAVTARETLLSELSRSVPAWSATFAVAVIGSGAPAL